MMIKHFITIAGCLFLLDACVPQAELVKMKTDLQDMQKQTKNTNERVRELQKRFDDDANVKGAGDVQKMMADSGAKTDQLATDIQLVQGRLEENNFRIAELAQKLDDKSFIIAEHTARIDALEARGKLLSAVTGTAGTAFDPDKKSAPKILEPSEAYRQAKSDFDKGNFDIALAGFQNYLALYPDTSLAAPAQYWIGECYYSRQEFTKAIEAFETVFKKYPKSDKAPGAKLKVGLTYLRENNMAKAKEYLKKVVKEHPNTNEAEIAADQLKKIGK